MCLLLISKDEIGLVFIPAYYFLMSKHIFVFLVRNSFFVTKILSKIFKHTLNILLSKL